MTATNERQTKVEKRAGEFQAWFDGFTKTVRTLQSQGIGRFKITHDSPGNFTFAPKAALAANELYWKSLDEFVRPMVKAANGDPETNIDRYKICSTTELTIVSLQPIDADSDAFARYLNARLAYHCALCFLANWHNIKPDELMTYVGSKIAENHAIWLESYDPEDTTPPFFSNAVTWQLIEENYALRREIAKKKPA